MIRISNLTAEARGTGSFRCEERERVTAVFVSAKAVQGAFPADGAMRLTLEETEPVARFMADVLYSPYWCRPEFGADLGHVPARTQGVLYQYASGRYGFLLPLSHGAYVTDLSSADGRLTATVFSGVDSLRSCECWTLVAAEGEDPYELPHRCAAAAARLLGSGLRLREARRYPEIFEYLGWCTWDAMEIWVNEAEILEKCGEFREKGIPVRWAILDDMWADVAWKEALPRFTPHSVSFGVMHASTMNDYEADPVRFPHGLAGCIARMKDEYGMKVGVWHPTSGYWAGLTPGGPAARRLASVTVTTPQGCIMPDLGDAGRAYKYYAAMHRFFRACGADFLKIDNQSFLRGRFANVFPLGDAARNLHMALEGSVGANFDGALINCMCMASENMFARTTTAITRCSDDFKPEDRAWFAKHIQQCAYNDLFQGQFTWGDWDMWWSDDEQATKNSVLRALSGGPIYVSDRLGRSRPEIFRPLCFSDGRILRADGAAVPTRDCLLTDCTAERQALCVWNTAGRTAYVAAFNLHTDGTAVAGRVAPAEIPGLAGDTFVLREHFSGRWRLIGRAEAEAFTLADADDFRLWSLTPVEAGTAVLGDADKFLGVRAVTDAGRGFVRLVEGGTLLLYRAEPVTEVTDAAGAPLPFTWEGGMTTVTAAPTVTEIHYR